MRGMVTVFLFLEDHSKHSCDLSTDQYEQDKKQTNKQADNKCKPLTISGPNFETDTFSAENKTISLFDIKTVKKERGLHGKKKYGG